MKELTVFNYNEMPIRTLQKDDQTWWVLADVCKVLEITNARNVAARLDDDEKNTVHLTDGIPGNPNITVINEPGLYSVILRSDKPEAKAFKRWVTHEVLPAIRRNGAYSKSDERYEIAKLIATCDNSNAVNGILALYGYSAKLPHKFIDDSVSAYLNTVETWELTTPPTNNVYSDYICFCREEGYTPISLIGFSRCIHAQKGLIVKRMRINGILTPFYR